MTASEMDISFKIQLDKIDSLNYPDLTVTEREFFLNLAQDRIVKQRYGVNNNKRQSFEETQKRTDDLKAVVVNSILSPASNASDNIDINARFVTLPNDYWFTIQERADITYTDCNNKAVTEKVSVYPVQHYEFNKFISNPFKRPSKNRVLRLMENNRTELVYDSSVTPGSYYLRYIKKPRRISITNNIDCELSDSIHEEIVSDAVSIALESIEAKRTNSYDKNVITNE